MSSMTEFRWIDWDLRDGHPPRGALSIGAVPQQCYRVLQYRERFSPYMNAAGDIVLQKVDSPEWKNVQ